MRTTLLEEEQREVRAELEETHAALGRAQGELEEVRGSSSSSRQQVVRSVSSRRCESVVRSAPFLDVAATCYRTTPT